MQTPERRMAIWKELLAMGEAAAVCDRIVATWSVPPELIAALVEVKPPPRISPTELRVLRGIADGRGQAWIAADMLISEETVKRHVSHLLAKLGARNSAHLAAIGLRSGLLAVEEQR